MIFKSFFFRFSFRIIRKKLIQYELRNYGQLRLLNRGKELTSNQKKRNLIYSFICS
jgi:hypothetical protein